MGEQFILLLPIVQSLTEKTETAHIIIIMKMDVFNICSVKPVQVVILSFHSAYDRIYGKLKMSCRGFMRHGGGVASGFVTWASIERNCVILSSSFDVNIE